MSVPMEEPVNMLQIAPDNSVTEIAPLKDIADMTTDEKLDEILMTMRAVGATLHQFQGLGPMGIMKMFMGK